MQSKNVDFSSFGWRDAANIALQRTGALISLPSIGNPGFSLWARGIPGLLYLEAIVRRKPIIVRAIADIERDFREIRSFLGQYSVQHMVDIGCGHAIIDLFFYREFRTAISLIDIERTSNQHHDFHSSGAGYTSLAAAKRFLIDNRVPAEAVSTTNPRRERLPEKPANLVISLLSAGFHYPVAEYLPFALDVLIPGGVLIFDARKGEGQLDGLGDFRKIRIIRDHPKYERVAAFK